MLVIDYNTTHEEIFLPGTHRSDAVPPPEHAGQGGHLLPGEGTAGLKKRKTLEAASLLVAVAAHEATCVVARSKHEFRCGFRYDLEG